MTVQFRVATEVAGRRYAAGASVALDDATAYRLLAAGLVDRLGPRPGPSIADPLARHVDPQRG